MPNLPWTHRTTYQMTLIALCDTVQIVNVFAYEVSTLIETSLSSDQLAIDQGGLLADDWISNLKTSWLAFHPSDYTLQMVKVQCVERPANFRHRLSPIERSLTTANVGTQPQGSDVGAVAAIIKWRTPQAGKSHRGRSYVGPIGSNWHVNGALHATGVTTISAFGSAMIARYAVGGTKATDWVLTIYSRPYNSGEYQYATRKTGTLTVVTPPDYAGNSTNVTAFQLDPNLRIQRRRELGVGS